MTNASIRFETKVKNARMVELALIKFGFSKKEICQMSEIEAGGYIEAFLEISNPKKNKAYKVKRK